MDEILNKIKSFFSSALGGTSLKGSVIGVDIGTSGIKVVQLRRDGSRAILETYGTIALGPYGQSDVGKVTNLVPETLTIALNDVLRESGMVSGELVATIPAQSSLVFILTLPASIDEKTLSEVIPNEAKKYIPVPIDEVSLDWFLIPKRETTSLDEDGGSTVNPTEVLVVVIHNEVLKRYQNIMKQSSLPSSFFEVETFSAVRSAIVHELSPVMIFDFGASKTKLSIVEYGVVREVHIINKGGADITQNIATSLGVPFARAEQLKKQYGLVGDVMDGSLARTIRLSTDFILSEANNVMIHYEKKNNKTIGKAFLIGGGSLLKGFLQEATSTMSTEVFLSNPFIKVDAPAFLIPTLESIGPEFAHALGIALRKLES